MFGYSFFHDCHNCSMALCKLQAQKTLNAQPRKNSKGRLASGFERLVHSLIILNAFANLNSTQQNEKKRCSNLKNKRSSRLSQLKFMKWSVLSESLHLLQILLQAKSFFWSIQIWTEKFGAQGKILLKVHKLNERFPAWKAGLLLHFLLPQWNK